jgi:hypothetical protein
MSIHPALAPALAEQHRLDLTNQASACRLARTARQDRPRNPSRRPLIVKALRAAAAASAIAAAAFLAIPAGPIHAPSAHTSWGTSSQVGDSHRAVLVVHYRTHRFGVSHHFQADHHFAAGHVYNARWA